MQPADRLVARTVQHGGRWLAVLTVAAFAGAFAELALPLVLGRTVDSVIAAGPDRGTWLAGCAAVIAVVVGSRSLGIWAGGASGAQATAWLRRSVVHRVLGVGPTMNRRFADGDLVTRTGVNTEEVGRAPEAVVAGAALAVPTVGSVVALALIDPWLAVTLVAGLAVITVVLRTFMRQTTTIASGYQQAQSAIATRLIDALAGVRTIAAAGTVDLETRRVLKSLPTLHEYGIALWRTNARSGVRAAAVVPLLEVVVLTVGGLQLAAGDLTVGELYAAARYAVLGSGLGSALGFLSRLARARSAAQRVDQVFQEQPTAYGSRRLPDGPSALEFRNVTADGLDGVDLMVPAGCAVAIVGRSGAGKSMLAAAAGRLIDPAEGTVLLDGVPLPQLARDELRRAVGYAFERPVLVGETLDDVIGLGRRDTDPDRGTGHDQSAGREAVRVAARAACADDFIRRLPQGYATRLEDAPMSGGERQRIGLARAFAHGERLLILDDATSSLDTMTERQVTAALTGQLRDRTRLIVAHRAATAAGADRVVWLDNGRVRAYDHHEALWEDPDYRAVFEVRTP